MAGPRTLLAKGRRHLAVLLIALLAAPLLAVPWAPYDVRSVYEARTLAPPPAPPKAAADWLKAPRALDAWIADHFAGRQRMLWLALNLQAGLKLRSQGAREALHGRGDWLLLYSGLLELTGGRTRPPRAERFGRFACDMAQEARARGATFLFAPAPGTVEINPEAVPAWVPRGAPTQTDLVLQAARRCGLEPLDLRPSLRAARSWGKLYQHHDSHWTELGALAAFDQVAARLGRPWALDPAALRWVERRRSDSDLVRLSGELNLPPETIPALPDPPGFHQEPGSVADLPSGSLPHPFEVRPPGARETVLVIGDSYAGEYLPALFWRAGVNLVWVHHQECNFDRRVLERVKADVVLLMPTTRFMLCR